MSRLLQLQDECGRIQAVLSHKAGLYSDQAVSKLLIQASALTEFLNEVKVSYVKGWRDVESEGDLWKRREGRG